MRLELKTFTDNDLTMLKSKIYECNTMDPDMKASVKNVQLESILLDDISIYNEQDIDDLIEFLKNAKRSFKANGSN